jgi:hypothetical protein
MRMPRKRFQPPEVKNTTVPTRGWRNSRDQNGSLVRMDSEEGA